MLLRVFKSHQIYNLFLIPVLGIFFGMKAYLSPETFDFFPGEDQMPLYTMLTNLLSYSVLTGKIFTSVAILVILFLIVRISTIFGFLRTRSYLPGTIYVILLGGLPNMHFLHPVWMGTIFLLLCVYYLFDSYNKNEILNNCFATGLLLGVGSLFYFPLIFFIPLLIIGYAILARMYQWRHLFLPLVGFITPWAITASIYFLSDSFPHFKEIIINNSIQYNQVTAPVIIQYYTFFVAALSVISGLFLLQHYDTKKISTRKYLSILTIYLLTAGALPWIFQPAAFETVIILLIPVTYYISHYLLFINNRIIPEVIFYLMLAASVFVQFVN